MYIHIIYIHTYTMQATNFKTNFTMDVDNRQAHNHRASPTAHVAALPRWTIPSLASDPAALASP